MPLMRPIQSKPVTPWRRWGTPTDASTVTAAHRRLSSATRTIDDIDCPIHSLMLSFHDFTLSTSATPSVSLHQPFNNYYV